MDYILFGFVGIGALIGAKKGGLGIFVTLFVTLLSVYISYEMCGKIADSLQNVIDVKKYVGGKLSSLIADETTTTMFFETLEKEKFGFAIVFVLKRILAGCEIQSGADLKIFLTEKISTLVLKAISFLFVFIVVIIVINIALKLIKKTMFFVHFGKVGSLIGGCVGMFYGLIMFCFVYNIALFVGNITLNEAIISFVEGGTISKLVCAGLYEKTINLLI